MAGLSVRVVPGLELTEQQAQRWRLAQAANTDFESPFLAAEFTQAVAAVRDDVFVAVLEDETGEAGFFPFQRSRARHGTPVGSGISDYQAFVVRRGAAWDARSLLRACGLVSWRFDHLLASQLEFSPFHLAGWDSLRINLSHGFEEWVDDRRLAGSDVVRSTRRKARKLERERGTLRFVADEPDPDVLRALMRWKSAQYRRTGVADRFGYAWIVDVLTRLHQTNTSDFAGVLSALYAGDSLVAAHFGPRSSRVLHWWFPSYDPEYGAYSPGSIMLLHLAEAAAGLSLRAIDLGAGEEAYKRRFAMNGVTVTLCGGDLSPAAALIRRLGALRRLSLR